MRIAVLCPGPSLTRTYPDADRAHDIVIGVNRAVLAFRCDWWSFMDRHVFHEWRPDYPVKLFTLDNVSVSTSHIEAFNACEVLVHPAMRTSRRCAWNTFSATSALVLAAEHLRADTVDVYGADMVGAADYDGKTDPRFNRTDKRWGKEVTIWNRTVETLLNDPALPVTRIERHGNA